jgi:hypothetical protein
MTWPAPNLSSVKSSPSDTGSRLVRPAHRGDGEVLGVGGRPALLVQGGHDEVPVAEQDVPVGPHYAAFELHFQDYGFRRPHRGAVEALHLHHVHASVVVAPEVHALVLSVPLPVALEEHLLRALHPVFEHFNELADLPLLLVYVAHVHDVVDDGGAVEPVDDGAKVACQAALYGERLHSASVAL